LDDRRGDIPKYASLPSILKDTHVKIDDILEGGRKSEVTKEIEALRALYQKKGSEIGEIKGLRSCLDVIQKQVDMIIHEQKQAKSNMMYGDAASINAEIK